MVEHVPWGMDGHHKVKGHMLGSMNFYGQILTFYGAVSTWLNLPHRVWLNLPLYDIHEKSYMNTQIIYINCV